MILISASSVLLLLPTIMSVLLSTSLMWSNSQTNIQAGSIFNHIVKYVEGG